jgi:flagellar biosynthesis activator protein FlaF
VNALEMAHRSYARPDTPARSPRDIEYDLLARITRRLTAATATADTGFGALVAALHDNEEMWRTFAMDVAEPTNGLPAELRAKLYYLYEFTAHHSPKVRDGSASVDVLVDINTAVMRGLRGERGAP